MKLLRIGAPGMEKPAVLDSQSMARSLAGIVDDFSADWFAAGGIESLRSLRVESLPPLPADQRIGSPVAHVGKIICVGLNYTDHAAESGLPAPAEPILFLKAGHVVQGPDDPVKLPRGSKKLDWEVELGVVIGRRAAYVSEAEALDHVAGYCVCNDLSEREFQLERGGQWDKGKNCETFGPLGPWLVTKESVADPQNLKLWLDVNGRRFQSGNTARMIFGVRFLVHYISQFMPLEPGDVISTGTPAGVGLGQRPPVYLREDDVVRLGIEGLGEQQQRVVSG
jgi:ureidoglycolate lyase/2,4-diketo-3-deoxy-L-fuconate hydrolase